MDYEELVKFLRSELCVPYTTMKTMQEAADAIEELQAAVEREKNYTQFWEDAAKTCKVQYEKMEKKMLDWQAVADEHWEAYQHWFHNYMNDMPKWIPVTERLPEDGQWVLVWGHGQKIPIMMFRESGAWIDDQFEFHTTVTHWMRLPEPPKEETE